MSDLKKVGVLVSYGYGAGWSTWGCPEMALDQEIVEAIEDELPYVQVKQIAERNWPDECLGGLYQCKVVWLDEGTIFRIEDCNGAESIHFPNDYKWQVAK